MASSQNDPNEQPHAVEADFSYLSDGIFDLADDKEEEADFEEFDFEIEDLSTLDVELKPEFESSGPYERVKIVQITESFYEKEGRKFRFPERVAEGLKIQNEKTVVDFVPIKIVIRDDWLHCRFGVDSVLNVIGRIEKGQIIVDNEIITL